MRRLFALMMLCMCCALTGCGEGSTQTVTVQQIQSDRTVDGYITLDPLTGSLTVTEVERDQQISVLVGVNPTDPVLKENRAFLNFPLQNIIPGKATIDSATLDIVVRSIVPRNGMIPITLELISFAPPLLADYFDHAPIETGQSINIPSMDAADVGVHQEIDVTQLMRVAQLNGFPSFQLRVMAEPGATSSGLVEINDNIPSTAPLLTVNFH